jgi:hypothetical protein
MKQRPEDIFCATFRQQLAARYRGRGCWWLNSAGYELAHRDPFGGRGAGDLIGLLCGRWVEIELKAKRGRLGEMQKLRAGVVRAYGGVYLVVREGNEAQAFAELDAIDCPNWALKGEPV